MAKKIGIMAASGLAMAFLGLCGIFLFLEYIVLY
jgi:hypothetical protein